MIGKKCSHENMGPDVNMAGGTGSFEYTQVSLMSHWASYVTLTNKSGKEIFLSDGGEENCERCL